MSTPNLGLPTFFTGHIQTINQVKAAIGIIQEALVAKYGQGIPADRLQYVYAHTAIRDTVNALFREVEALVFAEEGAIISLPWRLSGHLDLQNSLREGFAVLDDALYTEGGGGELPEGSARWTLVYTGLPPAGIIGDVELIGSAVEGNLFQPLVGASFATWQELEAAVRVLMTGAAGTILEGPYHFNGDVVSSESMALVQTTWSAVDDSRSLWVYLEDPSVLEETTVDGVMVAVDAAFREFSPVAIPEGDLVGATNPGALLNVVGQDPTDRILNFQGEVDVYSGVPTLFFTYRRATEG